MRFGSSVVVSLKNPICIKWMFKNKLNIEGKVENYKAWLLAKGYFNVEGIEFGDLFHSCG